MIEAPISHDEALDLFADSLDFDLDDDEKRLLDGHLAGCDDCRTEAAIMEADDELLEGFDWSGDDSDYGRTSDEYDEDLSDLFEDEGQSRSPDEDDDAYKSSGPDGDDEHDDEGGQTSDLAADGEASDDEAEHDHEHEDRKALGRAAGGTADDEDLEDDEDHPSGGGGSPIDAEGLDEDEEPDSSLGSAPTGDGGDEDFDVPSKPEHSPHAVSDDSGAGAQGTGAQNHDADDDEVDMQAEADAEAMAALDEILADLESDADPDDVLAELTQALDKAVEDSGARFDRKRAELILRDEEGILKTDFGRVAVYKSTKGIVRGQPGSERPQVSGSASAAIRNAILRSRTGTSGRERYQTRGKLDGKSLHRVVMNDRDLFSRNIAADPGKFLVWVLCDVSGSMSGQPIADVATVARALADATYGTPTVRLEVWGWSNPFRQEHAAWGRNARTHCEAGVVRVWRRGMPTTKIFELTQLPMGGTPDAPITDWAWREMLKARRSDETPVMIMLTDGFGDYNMHVALERARKHGVLTKSVALGRYVSIDEQELRYGRGNYVPWHGSIEATARPIADMIARMAQGR